MLNVYEHLMFIALGGLKKYRHKPNKENKNITKLQDFLDSYVREKKYEKKS